MKLYANSLKVIFKHLSTFLTLSAVLWALEGQAQKNIGVRCQKIRRNAVFKLKRGVRLRRKQTFVAYASNRRGKPIFTDGG